MHPPFRYPGGKFFARHIIAAVTPPHTAYGEPFAGGASIFFNKEKAEQNFLNDLDADVIVTYQQIQANVEAVLDLACSWTPSKEQHAFIRDEFKPTSDVEIAARWYFLNRTSYSGITTPYNCYWGKPYKPIQMKYWQKRLREASVKLQGVALSSLDFEQVIDSAPDGAFLLVDPPYYKAYTKKYYVHTFDVAAHERLAAVLKRNQHRLKFLLTYDDCPEVKALYDWAGTLEEKEWTYCIARTDHLLADADGSAKSTKRTKGQELFVMNYDVPRPAPPLALPETLTRESVGKIADRIKDTPFFD